MTARTSNPAETPTAIYTAVIDCSATGVLLSDVEVLDVVVVVVELSVVVVVVGTKNSSIPTTSAPTVATIY